MEKEKVTFTQYLLNEQKPLSSNTGNFYFDLVIQLCQAAKRIARELNRAPIENRLGYSGDVNIQGEKVKKMDQWANDLIVEALKATQSVCTLVSEEMDKPLHLGNACDDQTYIVCFDPVDGSSNIDINGILGTIFSVRRQPSPGLLLKESNLIGIGHDQVSAGYIMYGPSTLLVYSSGSNVNGFTLDSNIGDFVLTHQNIQMPKKGTSYSVNGGNYCKWHPPVRTLVDYFQKVDPETGRPYSHRYTGSLVADFHRTLLEGGIYLYPPDAGDSVRSKGKLRLLYEAAPLAFIAQAAGGRASTGEEDILNLQASSYHQRVPLMIGSQEMVILAEEYYRNHG